ncbi:putative bifunctional diguanylate cyclase/phosphodiesterase [Halomonas salifodinae]|uniref:putative bifunctional diguanylate cyclase/phosphodiesterase n=1 Tax=Halomonas salifodinae TaxID=438745 RepID=UPI0033B38097
MSERLTEAMRQLPILVVDDHPINVELLIDLLEDRGFSRVDGLMASREVVARCRRDMPALILLDIRMPHLDGHGVMRALDEAFGNRKPAVIVLTAQADEETRHQALGLGARDVITKPFDHREVLQRVCNALEVEQRYARRHQEAVVLEHLVAERTRELERLSHTDPVTGLPNRRALMEALDRLALEASGAAVLYIVLDAVHDVARLHGHDAAERLVAQLGAAIAQWLPEGLRLGLWGGSELLIVLPDPGHGKLRELAGELHRWLAGEHAFDEMSLTMASRVGVAAGVGVSPQRLVQMAALALPASSDTPIRLHSDALERAQRDDLELNQALHGVAQRRELSLVYQPKLHMQSGRVVGAEALLRWQHPRRGFVSPGRFIPMAEASGEILSIGDWVLEASMQSLTRWCDQQRLARDFCLAVNVAARQLCREGFAADLLARLERHALPVERFSIEVTESGLMADLAQARRQLALLSESGVRVAIDDFGTGHSSLAYLKSLPISTLKIDRAFVTGIAERREDRKLAATITALAHGMECDVVAEGVETRAQAECLVEMGCDIGQGYLFARPLPEEAFLDWYPMAPAALA